MKILLINKFYYLKGGTEKHFFQLKNVLEKNGHEVIVFSTENKKNIQDGKNEYFIPEIKMKLNNFLKGFKLFYNRQAVRELKKIIINNKIDVAHLHNISHHFSPAIIKVLKKNNIPVVMTVHDYKLVCPNYKLFNQDKICEKCQGGKFYNCTINKCVKNSYLGSLVMTLEAYWSKWMRYYENVDIFIAPSRFMANKLISNNFDIKKIKYLPNFLNSNEADSDLTENREENYILFFGRLSKEKGVDVLIKSIGLLENKETKLKIVGEGEELNNLKKLAKELKLEERVEFLGYKSGDELKTIIKKANFIVAPSVWYENAPYSILEAFLYKKAVVGSLVGGISELVVEGKSGLTFEIGNQLELAKKADYLLANLGKAQQMGENGSRLIKNQLNEEGYYKRLNNIYESLIKINFVDKK
jgi:glycosyltransferase involved in cell wall biosynthesis